MTERERSRKTAQPKHLPKAAKKLQELREKWKALGAVPKVKADEINPRYLNATRLLQHRVDEYFAQLRQTQNSAYAPSGSASAAARHSLPRCPESLRRSSPAPTPRLQNAAISS